MHQSRNVYILGRIALVQFIMDGVLSDCLLAYSRRARFGECLEFLQKSSKTKTCIFSAETSSRHPSVMEIQATVSGATTGEEVASHAVLHSDKFGSALTVQLYINKSWKNGMWYYFL